jgi:hypothetical protein
MALIGSFGAFVTHLVAEREERTLYLMCSHGVSASLYLVTTYLTFAGWSVCLFGVIYCITRWVLVLPVMMHTN